MKIRRRLFFYAGVILFNIGLLLLPDSKVTSWIIAGSLAYLAVSIGALVVDAILLHNFTPKEKTFGLRTAQFGKILGSSGFIGVVIGIVVSNPFIVQTSTFLLLIGAESHITREEWAGEK